VSDYETTQRRRNFIVGVFVFAAIAALVGLIWQFGDLPASISMIGSFEVFVQFPTASGVQTDTPVRFCGYQIGTVTGINPPKVMADKKTNLEYHQTIVIMSIDNKFANIPSNVEVKLMSRGLGSSYIELMVDPTLPWVPLDPNRPETKYLVNEMTVQGSTGVTSEFFPEESMKKLEELASSLVTLIGNVNDVLGDSTNKENIKRTLANLTEASGQATLALKGFEEFSSAGVEMSAEMSRTISQLRVVLEKINEGEGTAGRLINDGKLYENLLENTEQLQILLEDLIPVIEKLKEKGVTLL
jgi:phospholipid/cholesterol/gamma-HCH transport system substrate-binding protein